MQSARDNLVVQSRDAGFLSKINARRFQLLITTLSLAVRYDGYFPPNQTLFLLTMVYHTTGVQAHTRD